MTYTLRNTTTGARWSRKEYATPADATEDIAAIQDVYGETYETAEVGTLYTPTATAMPTWRKRPRTISDYISKEGVPTGKVVLFRGLIGSGMANRVGIITGYYSNAQGYGLTISTPADRSKYAQAYGETIISEYVDQEAATAAFTARKEELTKEFQAASRTADWSHYKELVARIY